MAIPEACQVWIKQRIEEEQERGTPHPEIGRIVGKEIVKYFEVKIAERTIEQQSRRIATNVANNLIDRNCSKTSESCTTGIQKGADETMMTWAREKEVMADGSPIEPETGRILDLKIRKALNDLKSAVEKAKERNWKKVPKVTLQNRLNAIRRIIVT